MSDLMNSVDTKMLNLYIDIQSTQSPATAKTYRSVLVNFMDAVAKPMAHVTVEDIRGYARTIEHLAPSTQYRMLSTVKSFFRFLHAQPPYNQLPNAFEGYKLPKMIQNQVIERILTKKEVDAIRAQLRYRNRRNWLFVSFLYASGLRISELTQAKWCDIISDQDGNIGLRVLGKGKKIRYVVIKPKMFDAIVDYRTMNGLGCIIGSCDESPLFPNRNGKHMTSRYIEQMVHDAAERAGIKKKVSPHWFRHAAGSHALYNGASVFQVQQMLGHGDLKVTLRYLHSMNKLQDTAADFIDVEV